jgi:hypothetical protein
MKRLTAPAEGIVGQLLFTAVAMLSSRGALKAGLPLVDDEGRDVEVHLAGKFRAAFAIQVKMSTRLTGTGKYRRLEMAFGIRPENLIDHPCYWYLFAHIDLSQMRLSEYMFLVPAREIHSHLAKKWNRGLPFFDFKANIDPNAHDRWSPYRVKPVDVGKHLVKLMREAPQGFAESEAFATLAKVPGLCFVGTAPAEEA